MSLIKIDNKDKINHLGYTLYRVVNEATGKRGGYVSKEVTISDDSWVEYEGAVISGNGGKIFLTDGTTIEGTLESHSQVTKVKHCFFRGVVKVMESETYTAEFVDCKTIDRDCKVTIVNQDDDNPIRHSDNLYIENLLMSGNTELTLSPYGSVSRATLFSRGIFSIGSCWKFLVSDVTVGERCAFYVNGFSRVGISNLTVDKSFDAASYRDFEVRGYGLVNYMGSCLIYNTKYDDDGEKAKIIRVEEKDMDIIIENGLRRDK
jgi:hypothetical protein